MPSVAGVAARRRQMAGPGDALRAVGIVAAVFAAWHVHASPVGGLSPHAVAEHGLLAAAMMLPLAASSAGLVAERSLRRRRKSAVGEHLVGFAFVWAGFGMCAGIAVTTVRDLMPPQVVFACLAGIAAAWQLSDARRRAADRCGYVRLGPPAGWRCDVSTVVAGFSRAVPCLRTCALPMGAMVAAPHPLVMLLMYGAYLSEWLPGANPFGGARRRRPFPAYAAMAVGGAVASVT